FLPRNLLCSIQSSEHPFAGQSLRPRKLGLPPRTITLGWKARESSSRSLRILRRQFPPVGARNHWKNARGIVHYKDSAGRVILTGRSYGPAFRSLCRILPPDRGAARKKCSTKDLSLAALASAPGS